MPLISYFGGLTVRFFSSDCREPIHVHVFSQSAECKVWIDGWRISYSKNFNERDLNDVIRVLKQMEGLIRKRWYEHCKNAR